MIKLAAYFTSFGSKADGSARLAFASQELNPEDFAELKRNLNSFGWLVFQENPVSEKDIPSENAEEEGKSVSQRIRSVYFLIWKKMNIGGDFQVWYRKQEEIRLQELKEKLD